MLTHTTGRAVLSLAVALALAAGVWAEDRKDQPGNTPKKVEDQPKAAQEKPKATEPKADQEKARAEVKRLEDQMEKLHQQMRETAEQLLKARVAAGEKIGHTGRRAHFRHHGAWARFHHGPRDRFARAAWMGRHHAGHRHAAVTSPDLDRKVDQLLKEVEELRQELKAKK
jgi:hypothetical protein